jgi:GntR family transcriptional regulator, transcriptional repressor for pyruvate dehydrogenase complex
VSDAPGLPIEYRPHFDRQSGKTASPDKASVEVARRIIDDLVKQGYRVGDRFPPEPDMLKVYEVSRETLREGLRLLEVQGLITIRRGPGGGPRVAPVNAAYLARSASLYFHVSGATYREVFEAWLDMEPTLVARVARREDRGEVARVLKPFTHTELGNDPRAVFDSAAAFHSEIGRLSGNRVLVLLLQSINHILTELMMERIDLTQSGAQIEHDHEALARAIVNGHARKAEMLARDHIIHLWDDFEARADGRIDDIVDWR